jgi:hypothetical protein
MTALKPIEDLRVRGVAARRYPLNGVCAHPECTELAVDPHHVFPRSLIGNDSWFVVLGDLTETSEEKGGGYRHAIPHVTGLCRPHHEAVELHDAWIKLEEGEFVWYDRDERGSSGIESQGEDSQTILEWIALGPLNPQPGSKTGRPKRKRFKGEARRNRATISVKVPQDAQEDGAGLWDEAIENLEAKISGEERRPIYYTIMDALNYTILNAGPDDIGG